MSRLLVSAALTFALVAPMSVVAESVAQDATTSDTAPADIEALSAMQLEALKARIERQGTTTREENAALNQRIAELEQKSAALGAKKTEVEARLADVLERLSRLEAAKKD